ncbi:uncharacterized protein [Typha latifolia]|uniref:uncharacterized protein n=1 Tax=Typha latifolia TaxID=4733 RepID=UPI003C3018C0
MCNSKFKTCHAVGLAAVRQIDGRAVLQPASNRVVVTLEAGRPMKKSLHKSLSLPTSFCSTNDLDDNETRTPLKRSHEANFLNSSTDKPVTPKPATKPAPVVRKKSNKMIEISTESSLFSRDRTPGSIAARQREHASLMQAQRKMRIAHYGRAASKLEGKVVPLHSFINATTTNQEEKRCSFITSNSDPLYVAYHDNEWGVPVHDDKMLFELLVLTGAQVGSDWTTILKKRNDYRAAFAGFDAEGVAQFSERQMAWISAEYGLELVKIRGIVDNANRILEVRRELGSLAKYLWAFVNHKPLSPNYKFSRKIPVKTSKSESISKDMVRRGFRFVGPTVIHSFMQAAGLTNDHLVSCPRHLLPITNPTSFPLI